MKLKAIAPWFGGKRTLAPRVIEQLGEHTQYFEPFCGSMAVLLVKPVSAHETVNDLHRELTNLAIVLQDEKLCPQLYDRLTRTLCCEAILKECQSHLEDPQTYSELSPVDRAYFYFVACWMGRNGTAGTSRIVYQMAVRWTAGGGSPTVRFRSATESIPDWHDRLRNVVILNRDAFDIIYSIPDDPGIAIYVDPPYTKASRTSQSTSGRYRHDFSSKPGGVLIRDDHTVLAEALSRFEHTRVVVSYYDDPRIRNLYGFGWKFIDCTMHKNLMVQNTRGPANKQDSAPEILIVNQLERD